MSKWDIVEKTMKRQAEILRDMKKQEDGGPALKKLEILVKGKADANMVADQVSPIQEMALKCQMAVKDAELKNQGFMTRTNNECERLQDKSIVATKRIDDIQDGFEQM